MLIAQAYDLSEPVEFDYQLAHTIADYIRSCNRTGEARRWRAAGLTTKEIALQVGVSESYVQRLLKEV